MFEKLNFCFAHKKYITKVPQTLKFWRAMFQRLQDYSHIQLQPFLYGWQLSASVGTTTIVCKWKKRWEK